MTEREKMISGKLYYPGDPELVKLRTTAHGLCAQYSRTLDTDEDERTEIIKKLLKKSDDDTWFQGTIFFDYGIFTSIGKKFYANINFTVLDCCPVTIGDNVLIGPNVSLLTPVHPLRWQDREGELEYAKPITIQDNCWLGGGVIVNGGCTIGEGCVIGSGSIVTRDIPPNVFAAGNPCRVIRPITDSDAINLKQDLF